MRNLKLIIFLGFILSLAAGVIAGKLVWRPAAPPAGSALEAELGLTRDQCDRIRAIWEPLQKSAADTYVQAQRVELDREAAYKTLLTPQQVEQYARLKHEHDDRLLALQAKRDKDFHEAVAKTRQLLTLEQRERYEQMLKERLHEPADLPGQQAQQPQQASASKL